ncbi:GDSL-type esterase/lipase family protein [Rhodococcus sp. T2V]|uniref:SGNH/GDSL hydrolase family protein n=1 Tax=Rhodococcus sp. T2V TaxID=3034164 RepID=UPI0023E1523B|nr:GDSL-type esterase/lipase family protein [Rhodococcus sp. T2V]MDF3308699.1 GDSL-type esterase/lipase family protein [Rhodococcus sp. T2V]
MSELVTAHWINRLVRRDERPVKIVVLSDSEADGFSAGDSNGVKDFRRTWPYLLADELGKRLGIPVSKWIPCDTPNADHPNYEYRPTEFDTPLDTADRTGDTNGVPGSVWLSNSGPSGQTQSLTWDVGGDTDGSMFWAEVVVRGYPNYGTTDIDITSDAVTTTVTPGGQLERYHLGGSFGVAPLGAEIRVDNSVDGCQIMGIVEHKNDDAVANGLHMYNLAFAGKTAQDYAGWTGIAEGLPELLADVQPDLVIIALGGNDWNDGRTTAELKADLAAIVANVQGRSPDSEFLFIVPRYNDQIGLDPWEYFETAIAEAADAADSLVLTTQWTTPPGADGLFLTDGVHLTLSGARSYSDLLLPALYPR